MIRGYGVVASEEVGTATITDVGSGYSNGYHYYHQNEHGDIEYITGKDGKIENAYTYDVFGNITNSTELVRNRYTYNGEQYDQVTQQYYLRARYYNPLVGRFTQEDVYRGDGLNLYAYCGNNPLMYVDPSGYSEQCGTGSESGSKTVKNGATRAAQYSSEWGDASLQEAIDKFAPNVEPVVTSKGKLIYNNQETGISVVYDKNGNYFRIEDTTRPRGRNYLDIDGNDMNNEVVNGKTRGRSKADYQRVTHFNNSDK